MIRSTSLLILSLTKIKEKTVVLHTLSPDFGRRSFISQVGPNAPMALFLPMSILDAEVIENPKSDLWRVRNVSSLHSLNSIRTNLYKNTMALFMSEVLYRTVKDGDGYDGLFEWAVKSVLTLESLENDFSNYHLRFLLELASALGFQPSQEDLAPFAGEHLKDINSLLTLSLADSMLLPLNGKSRNGIADALLHYLSHHTESNINVQSLAVLSEVFR